MDLFTVHFYYNHKFSLFVCVNYAHAFLKSSYLLNCELEIQTVAGRDLKKSAEGKLGA